MSSRYELEKHTEDDVYCWRVRDVITENRTGYGMRLEDAEQVRDSYLRLDGWMRPYEA